MRLSLVIPTRDRADYLGSCLDAALAVPIENFEIVVCDNASTDHTQDVIAARMHDPRLRMVRQSERVSMRMNFETGMTESTGDYLIFIGDDDAVIPEQLPILLNLLKQRAPDVLSWTPPNYGWPISGFDRRTGRVRLRSSALFGAPKRLDVDTTLRALYDGDFRDLPSLYHGVVSRRFLKQIATADGVVFGGSVPDVYFGMRALHQGGVFLFSGHPFSVNGYSPASTGHAHHAYRSDDTRVAPARRFAEEAKADPLSDKVEHMLSIPGVFFATLETVRARMNPSVSTMPNYAVWYARVLSAVRVDDHAAMAAVRATLVSHAENEGAQAQLAQALAGKVHPPQVKKTRSSNPFASFSFTARKGTQNTVFTAAQAFDVTMGSNYSRVLSGKLSRDAAWRITCWRALQLKIKRLFQSSE